MANPIWQDMLFLQELNNELHSGTGGTESTEEAMGYKPYRRDPRWLTVLSFVLLPSVIVASIVIYWNLR